MTEEYLKIKLSLTQEDLLLDKKTNVVYEVINTNQTSFEPIIVRNIFDNYDLYLHESAMMNVHIILDKTIKERIQFFNKKLKDNISEIEKKQETSKELIIELKKVINTLL